MSAQRQRSAMRLFVHLAGALLVVWAFMMLAEYFGWRLLAEAGGQVARTTL